MGYHHNFLIDLRSSSSLPTLDSRGGRPANPTFARCPRLRGQDWNRPLEEALVHARLPVLLLEPRGDHIRRMMNQFLAGADVSQILMVNSAVAGCPSWRAMRHSNCTRCDSGKLVRLNGFSAGHSRGDGGATCGWAS